MSELAASVETGAGGLARRLKILGVLILSILAVGAPVVFSDLLYTPDGISKNGLITHLLLPMADALIMLLIVLIARRTQAAGQLELMWFRRSRFEVVGLLLLPAAALGLMLGAAWLADKLGFEQPMNRMFMPEGRGGAFFAALVIRIAIVTPVLEEVFWRGFVQRASERVAGSLPALLAQAALFALVHQPPLGRVGPALALGMVAGVWRWRRRTLVPIIVAHVVLNSLYCAGNWPHWQDYAKVRIRTDVVAQMTAAARPAGYDPNADARDWYERGFRAAVKMPETLGRYRRGFPVNWPEEVFSRFRTWVAENDEALEYMARGAAKPYYWPIYRGPSAMLAGMPQSDGARNLVFVMDARIKLRAFDREDKLLLADMATLYRFACHFGGVKVLSHQLVGVSIRSLMIGTIRGILATESLEPQTLAAIQRQLEEFADRDGNVLDFTLERLVWMDGIQRMFTDDGNGNGRIPRIAVDEWKGWPEPFRRLIDPLTPGQNPDFLGLDRRRTTQCADAFLDHIATAATMTPWDFHHGPNDVKGVLASLMKENSYVRLLGTAAQGVIELPWRARTDLDALIATLAVLRYEAERGEYPDSLTQLVETGFLRRVPRDAYSDGPLVYKSAEGGFLLYSRGLDFDDDGGVPSQWGQGSDGGDQVFWPVY